MKPIATNNLSFWGVIGYLILFNLPYIGTPANLIVAIFSKDRSTKIFSWVYFFIGIIITVVTTILGVGIYSLFGLDQFGFPASDGVQAFISSFVA